jgi:hypothetical protein
VPLCLAEFVTPKRRRGLAEACTEETLVLILVGVFERNVLRIIVSGQQQKFKLTCVRDNIRFQHLMQPITFDSESALVLGKVLNVVPERKAVGLSLFKKQHINLADLTDFLFKCDLC